MRTISLIVTILLVLMATYGYFVNDDLVVSLWCVGMACIWSIIYKTDFFNS